MSIRTDMLKASQPIVDELLGQFGSFITGSYAIGGDTIESDIDVVLPIDNPSDYLIDSLRIRYNLRVEPSNYNNGVKMMAPGRLVPVNIVRLHPFEYCAWLFATNTMAELPPVLDKTTRHRAFEALGLAYKLASPNSETLTIEGAHKYFDSHKPSMDMKTIINIAEVRNQ